MAFSSYQFIFLFVPVTILGFWLTARSTDRRWAIGWLIVTSVVFCGFAGAKTLAVIITSVAANYLCARVLLAGNSARPRLRVAVFSAGICLNIMLLVYLKREADIRDFSNTVLGTHFDLTRLELPLGISFLTFQMIGFLTDIYRNHLKEVRCLDYLLFCFFFPRVVAGPIVRYGELAPQFTLFTSRILLEHAPVAICLFSIGLFKKAIIADGLAPFVAQTFDRMTAEDAPSAITAWFASLAFSLQIYFDFSGYTDMALGVARLFGVRLPTNFNSPYKARSIVELWSRAHITLTLFLTEYVFSPVMFLLLRSRISKALVTRAPNRFKQLTKTALICPAIFVTTEVSGLWHGISWPFICWGTLHGVYLSVNQLWRALRPLVWSDRRSYERVMNPVGLVLTLICSTVALVFFRAKSVDSALTMLQSMAGLNGFLPTEWALLNRLGIDTWTILSIILSSFQVIKEYVWIIVLLLVVTLMPNSMEILRRFQPALDFHGRASDPPQDRAPSVVSAVRRTWRGISPLSGMTSLAWRAIQQFTREGMSLNRFTAMIIALLCALGVLALNDGVKFIYAQF